MLSRTAARQMQEFALAHAWTQPEEMEFNRSVKMLSGGWAIAMSVNR